MELKNVSAKRQTIRDFLIVAAFCILLFFMVFNRNETAAGLAFVMVPVTVFTVLIILCNQHYTWRRHYTLPVVMCIFAVISTLTSDVMSWNAYATSLVLFVLVYMLATVRTYEPVVVRQIMRFYSGLVVLIAFWVLVSYILGINLVDGRASISFFGIIKDQNYLTSFMTPAFAYVTYSAFFSKNEKVVQFFKSCILFVAIYCTGSRAALISVLAVFFVIIFKYMFYKKISLIKLSVLGALIVVLGAGLLWVQGTELFERMGDMEGYSSNIRLEIWEYAMDGFYARPILGSGIQAGTYYAQRVLHWYTHNCFIDILVGQGIVGAVLYLGMFLGFLKNNRGNRCFIGAYMIASFCPLFFVNGYEVLNFWMPMMLCQILSSTAREYGCESLLL